MKALIGACLFLVSLCLIPAVHSQSGFRRADSNGDGVHDLTDIVFTLNFLFLGGTRPGCMDSCDTNDDGSCDLTDAIGTANWLFLGGNPPPFPLAGCGADPTADELGCVDHAACTQATPSLDLTEPPECPPADPSGCGGCETSRLGFSHGVYGFSGEFTIEQDNLRIKGRGLDFVWAIKYRSRIGPKTALGNGWDFSYNIWIEPMGEAIVLHDGNTRADRYEFLDDGTPTGLWAARGFFRELRQQADGSYTLRFASGGAWHFHPLDGGPRAGRIRSVADRNGNAIDFSYDGSGRLFQISDTLDRLVVIAHNPQGFIESVTDFAGRQVQFAYYQDGDAGGSAGDLKSVTSPAVTGTPTGNDFPNGKTTVFTYSKGFVEEELNHNLLSVTDPKGQALCRNEYAGILSPHDPLFDRITRQFLGTHAAPRDWVYVEETSNQGNNQAVIRVIENDPMGNVTETFFDDRNRLVLKQGFTGRADPGAPTTLTENRPTGKLRATDPPQFTTKIDWNADFLITETTFPNRSIARNVYESDLNAKAPPLSRGNLREIHRLPGSHQPAGDQARITELFEYDADFGSCCGSSFVTRHTDARGNVTIHQYDERGNRLRTQHRVPEVIEDFEYSEFGQLISHTHPDNGSGHRRRDEFTYHKSGPQTGYIEQDNIAAGGLSLTTRYEHDLVGNVIRKVDARGHDTLFAYNQLDRLVRETSREVADGTGVRYQKDFHYDLNDNLVRIDVQNVNDQGVLQANPHFTTSYAYDVLNRLVRKIEEVDAGRNVVTEFEYDANGNLTLTKYGQATRGDQDPATPGPQPQNTLTTLHDERNLVFRQIRAAGHADQSTVQYDYDPNGNLAVITELEELLPRIQRRTYDGFDRLVRVIDSMGNERLYEYDPNGNRTRERLIGEAIDLPGAALSMHLEDISFTFDAMDRTEVQETAFVDAVGTPIGDGKSTSRYRWSHSSKLVSVTDDNGHATLFAYDTADRRLRVTDPRGNTTTYAYDRNSNLVSSTRVEKSDLGSPDEIFTDKYGYDNLDRLIQKGDSGGNLTDYRYDSRGNLTTKFDALRAKPTDLGNVTRYVYDGLSRLLQVRRAMTSDGTGSGTPGGEVIAPRYTWDDSSHLVRVEDPRGSATTCSYDPLDRRTATTFADGTTHTTKFDVHDNAIEARDPNGTLVRQDFDLLNRLVRKEIEPGPGVSADTTLELYAYDGLSRLVRGEDDDSAVTRSYDSLSNLLLETQNGQAIDYTRDGEGNVLSVKYPGGRTIAYGHDALDRPAVITELEEMVGRNFYFGPSSIEARDLANNTRALVEHDKSRRVVDVRQILDPKTDGAVFDHKMFSWDKGNRKTSRADVLLGTETGYRYDSLHRLIGSTRTAGQAALAIDYQLDGSGNRLSVTGGPDAGRYIMSNEVPEPADLQMNQYTSTPSDGRLYDRKGNLTQIDEAVFEPNCEIFWDAGDRMVGFHHASGAVGTYAYDVFGRRIEKKIERDGKFTVVRYFYDGSRLIEEQASNSQTIATYLCPSDGAVLSMRRGGADYYFHQDDLGNVVVATDSLGKVIERYDYGDFGAPVVMDPSGNAIAGTAIGNHLLFAGAPYDVESGFYLMGGRTYDPRSGRFISRDPRGIWSDSRNLGNGFAYRGNSPWTSAVGAAGAGNEIPFDPTNPNSAFDLSPLRTDATIDFDGECEVRCESTPGSQYPHCKIVCRQSAGISYVQAPDRGRSPGLRLRLTDFNPAGLRVPESAPPWRGATIGGAGYELPFDAPDPRNSFGFDIPRTDVGGSQCQSCWVHCDENSQYCRIVCVDVSCNDP